MVNTYWYKFEIFIQHYGSEFVFILYIVKLELSHFILTKRIHHHQARHGVPAHRRYATHAVDWDQTRIPPIHPKSSPHPKQHTHTGGAVFINTGYAGGAFFFEGNPSIVKVGFFRGWGGGFRMDKKDQPTMPRDFSIENHRRCYFCPQIWIAGHSVVLGNPVGQGINTTYHGALALRKKGVTYFPAGAKAWEAQAEQRQWCVR
jgi:hypothetical protein